MVLNDRLRTVQDPYPWMLTAAEDVERLDGYLQGFKAECERLGARLVFATVPPSAALEGVHPADPVTTRALEIAAARGIPAVRLGGDLQVRVSAGGGLPIVPYDGHYDGEGNRLLAVETARFLATLDWFGAAD